MQPWGDDRAGDLAVISAVLHALRPHAVAFQTDLPLSEHAVRPGPVAEAAQVLLARSPRHRGDSADHATTGWLSVEDVELWSAFVAVAPYAYEAPLVSRRGALVSLDDLATAISLHLDPAGHLLVAAAVRPRTLTPDPPSAR